MAPNSSGAKHTNCHTAMCTNYKLSYITENGVAKTYWGMTELKGSQDQEEACAVRLDYHSMKPLACFDKALVDTFDIQPVGGTLTKRITGFILRRSDRIDIGLIYQALGNIPHRTC